MNQVPFRFIIYTGKTDLKLDSLRFLTLITKLQHIVHMGSPWTGAQRFVHHHYNSYSLSTDIFPTICESR